MTMTCITFEPGTNIKASLLFFYVYHLLQAIINRPLLLNEHTGYNILKAASFIIVSYSKKHTHYRPAAFNLFRCVRKIAKSDYSLRHVRLSSIRTEQLRSHWADFDET